MSIAWRESLNGYPLLLTAHVTSMGLVAGIIIFWDLRLAGIALKGVPVSKIQATMFPWMTLGLLINAGTGAGIDQQTEGHPGKHRGLDLRHRHSLERYPGEPQVPENNDSRNQTHAGDMRRQQERVAVQ